MLKAFRVTEGVKETKTWVNNKENAISRDIPKNCISDFLSFLRASHS